MKPKLNGLKVAILVTDGFEQSEFTEPKKALEQEGAVVKVVSDKHGAVQGFKHAARADTFDADLTFEEADPEDFDAVMLPGGVMNADQIRIIPKARAIVQSMQEDNKPIAVICHGSWLLVSAGLVNGRTLTSWPTLQDDIDNAGGHWVDQEVAEDKNWVSSRKPDDLPAFNQKMIEVFENYQLAYMRSTANERTAEMASNKRL